jgi:hypothetical protein
MQNSERQPFDETWKSAFDGAEMAPPNSLWKNIEVELAGNETDLMKRRVVFYQRIAAATVLFALVSGGVAVYNFRGNNELASGTVLAPVAEPANPQASSLSSSTPLSSSSQPQAAADAIGQTPSRPFGEPSIDQATAPAIRRGSRNDNSAVRTGSGNPVIASVPAAAVSAQDGKPAAELPPLDVIAEGRVVAGNERQDEVEEVVSPTEEKPVVELLSADQINAMAEAKEKEDKAKDEMHRSPWLGVNGAAGSYSPSASMSIGQADAMAAPGAASFNSYAAAQGIPQSYSHEVGAAYSAGISGGLKLTRRWVVQSGINYISQQVDYTTNFVGINSSNKATAMSAEFLDNSSLDVAVTTPYEASSTTQILSVPMQAGFMIVDRKVGWQLNTGVSTDFFLRNTLADKSGSREKISEGGGEQSPYRSVNWSGLLNTELSYRIGEHYRLAIVPGMRYAFQPMLKNQSGGAPLVLDVGFRFNYLFN